MKKRKKPGSIKKTQLQEGPVNSPGPKKNGGRGIRNAIYILIALFIIFNIVEIFHFIKLPSGGRAQKGAVLLYSWPYNYKGCTSIGEYGRNIYAIDNTRGDLYINEKISGAPVKTLNFHEGILTALEDSTGYIYVLVRTNEVLKIDPKNYSIAARIKPAMPGPITWMDVGPDNDFYLIGAQSPAAYKFDNGFGSPLSFGAAKGDKNSLVSPGKIFAGPGGDIYVMDRDRAGKPAVKIFSPDGKFINGWQARGIKSFDGMTGIAVDQGGNVYINVINESKIYMFSGKGRPLGGFTGSKDGKFRIVYAGYVTGGKNGAVYVYTHQIAAFKTMDNKAK